MSLHPLLLVPGSHDHDFLSSPICWLHEIIATRQALFGCIGRAVPCGTSWSIFACGCRTKYSSLWTGNTFSARSKEVHSAYQSRQ